MTRGIGTIGIPARIGAQPEIAVLRLKKAAADRALPDRQRHPRQPGGARSGARRRRRASTTAWSAAATWWATGPIPMPWWSGCAPTCRGGGPRQSRPRRVGLEDLEWFNPVARAAALWTLPRTDARKRRLGARACRAGRVAVDEFPDRARLPARRGRVRARPRRRPPGLRLRGQRRSSSSATRMCRAALSGTAGAWKWWAAPRFPATASCSSSTRTAPIWSIPAPSASRATATRAPPSCSTIPADGFLFYHRLAYDVATAQDKIRRAGLPPLLADRLAAGR